ncbi:MAG: HPr family phosphocarrier protein [Elusimicrobia bacterium]|nr:HPr family phosphocarrier protein [Elusimicrobiota bacterium]
MCSSRGVGVLQKRFIVPNKMGLHARSAAMLVQAAGRFASEVRFSKDGIEVNGKSVMGVMMLAAGCGSELEIRIWGPDEAKAMEAVQRIFDQKFLED